MIQDELQVAVERWLALGDADRGVRFFRTSVGEFGCIVWNQRVAFLRLGGNALAAFLRAVDQIEGNGERTAVSAPAIPADGKARA